MSIHLIRLVNAVRRLLWYWMKEAKQEGGVDWDTMTELLNNLHTAFQRWALNESARSERQWFGTDEYGAINYREEE